jgi:hypothetical protein
MNSVPHALDFPPPIPTPQESWTLPDWLNFAERLQEGAADLLERADTVLACVEDYPEGLDDDREGLILGESDTAAYVRKIERLKRRRAQIAGATTPTENTTKHSLTVEELATEMGFDVKKAYRWLRAGRFPGVFQPGGPGTEYFIPHDTPQQFQKQTAIRRNSECLAP